MLDASFTLLTEIQGYSTFVDVFNTTRSSTYGGQTNGHDPDTDGDKTDENSNADKKTTLEQNVVSDAMR